MSPNLGRFMTIDPAEIVAEDPRTLHRYVYVANNPVNLIDPDGTQLTTADIMLAGGIMGFLSAHIYIKIQQRYGRIFSPLELTLYYIGGAAGGAGLAYFATYPILTLAPATAGTAAIAGRGFSSFPAFKRVYGAAGPGQAWHHIVEKTPENLRRFGTWAIHNTNNLVKLAHGAKQHHNRISGFYSSINEKITGSNTLTIRQWLSTKSFEEQHKFGREAIQKIASGEWPP